MTFLLKLYVESSNNPSDFTPTFLLLNFTNIVGGLILGICIIGGSIYYFRHLYLNKDLNLTWKIIWFLLFAIFLNFVFPVYYFMYIVKSNSKGDGT